MKKLIVLAAVIAAPFTAQAADLPYKKAPDAPAPIVAAPPMFTWTGFYVGVNSGYGWQSKSAICIDGLHTCSNAGISHSLQKPQGFMGGAQIGYNWQFGSNVVLGLEADVDASSLNNKFYGIEPDYVGWSHRSSTKYDFISTVRGRFGYAYNRALFYVTAGLAVASFKDNYTEYNEGIIATYGNYKGILNDNAAKFGLALGGGIEYALTNNWSVNADYVHAFLGSSKKDISAPWTPDPTASHFIYEKFNHDLDIVRVGVNYKF